MLKPSIISPVALMAALMRFSIIGPPHLWGHLFRVPLEALLTRLHCNIIVLAIKRKVGGGEQTRVVWPLFHNPDN